MSLGKDESSISGKKKYLYMDKFIKHQEEDKTWKNNSSKCTTKALRQLRLGMWADITTFLIALAALGIAILK